MGGQQTKKSNASVGKYLIHGACFGLGKYEYVYIFFLCYLGYRLTGLEALLTTVFSCVMKTISKFVLKVMIISSYVYFINSTFT